MKKVRVLWRDAAGEGRFSDVDAPGPYAAIWQVAIDAEERTAEFIGVIPLEESE